MEKETKFPMTSSLRFKYELLNSLADAKNAALKPKGLFFKSMDSKAIIEVCRAYSEAKADFWVSVVKEYPELNGKDATADTFSIKLLK